ncbi:MAG: hypothetical protein V7K32_09390 [Nostoc sp.]|uniref:hypothetical protein n=1 Tax=Nostoc sp. TaxID=1180 RepID=UPI002FF8813C
MEPVDFSEVIAQIDVEMQQLSWTREQEREHLENYYEKRSHTLLTEVELLGFLQYLVSQPTPTLHEIMIAKINVEMQRLDWTTDQGQEHLENYYEKRSLTLLTEFELLHFLQYLASQSASPTLYEIMIAKINVEMHRLGWTREEEREHLKKNYDKRSRTLLIEFELLDFFQYLVSLPTVESPTDFDTEYEEFQDFSTYSEESDNVITRISSEDLSQILDKTDVQMQRLGLTPEQGREYLIKTYGKRSRTLLTDDELHEFFQYLQSQPSPPDQL